ncbi:MAG: carboxypeptidase-like regulatory domain-containing protein [Muribaculaceae bacterium]
MMSRGICIAILFALLTVLTSSAEVRIAGRVSSSAGEAIIGASVRVFDAQNKIVAFAISDEGGNYELIAKTEINPKTIVFSCLGYDNVTYRVGNISEGSPLNVILAEKAYELSEVVVKIPPIHSVGDTIVYRVSSFVSKSDRNIEDVIKRLPGIEVESDGRIMYNGEPINKFYIEGLDLLGGRYAIATRNIQPDDIESVNVYENHQPKQVLKNLRISDRAGIDLKLKKGMKLKPMGYVKGGLGSGDDLTWLGEIFAMLATKRNQTIVTAKTNNIGQSYDGETKSLTGENESNLYSALRLFSATPFGTTDLAKNRYYDNSSVSVSANTIQKLKQSSTLNVIVDYNYEKNRFRNIGVTEYWNGDSPIVIEENNGTHLNNQVANMQLKYENNASSRYVMNWLKARASFADNSHLLSQNISIGQYQRSNEIAIDNSFNTIIKRGDKSYELTSLVNVVSTPINYIHAYNPSTGEAVVHQSAKGLSFHTLETTSFTWPLSQNAYWGTKLWFDANYNTVLTANSELQVNDIAGYIVTPAAEPFVQVGFSKLTWRTEVPVKWQMVKFGDYSNSLPLVQVLTSLNYSPNRYVKASLKVGRRYSTGNISDMLENPIYVTYRQTQVSGTGELGKRRTDYVILTLNYRNPLKAIFGTLRMSYNRVKQNSLTSCDASESHTTQVAEMLENIGDNYDASLTLSKRLNDYGTTLRVSGSALGMNRQYRKQGLLTEVRTISYSAGVGVEGSLLHDALVVDLDLHYNSSLQKADVTNSEPQIDRVTLAAKVSVFPIKTLEVYGKLNYDNQMCSTLRDCRTAFVDAGMNLSYKKWEYSLILTNIANQKDYTYSVIRSVDSYTQQFALRGFEAMVTAKYKF